MTFRDERQRGKVIPVQSINILRESIRTRPLLISRSTYSVMLISDYACICASEQPNDNRIALYNSHSQWQHTKNDDDDDDKPTS